MLAPLPRRTPLQPVRGEILSAAFACTAALLASCSVLPEPRYPAHLDAEFAVHCLVPDSGRLQVPATATDLVVRTLTAEPPPRGEAFDRAGTRWLLYDRGTRVMLRANLRFYAAGMNEPVPQDDRQILFPEAVEWLDPR